MSWAIGARVSFAIAANVIFTSPTSELTFPLSPVEWFAWLTRVHAVHSVHECVHCSDATMMQASHSQAYLQSEMAAGFAVVMVDRAPRDLSTDFVVVDNVAGTRTATAHLIAHGRRRIALICDELSIATARDRRNGYLDGLREAAIDVDESLLRSARTEQASIAAVEELLTSPTPPTALFTARNTATVGAVAALRAHRLQHSIALVGFDDIKYGRSAGSWHLDSGAGSWPNRSRSRSYAAGTAWWLPRRTPWAYPADHPAGSGFRRDQAFHE